MGHIILEVHRAVSAWPGVSQSGDTTKYRGLSMKTRKNYAAVTDQVFSSMWVTVLFSLVAFRLPRLPHKMFLRETNVAVLKAALMILR